MMQFDKLAEIQPVFRAFQVLGVTNAHISRELVINQQTISNWKMGRQFLPEKHQRRLCDLLQHTIDDFESAIETCSPLLKEELFEKICRAKKLLSQQEIPWYIERL